MAFCVESQNIMHYFVILRGGKHQVMMDFEQLSRQSCEGCLHFFLGLSNESGKNSVSIILAREFGVPFYALRFVCGTGEQTGGKWVSNLVHMHTLKGKVLLKINLLVCWYC